MHGLCMNIHVARDPAECYIVSVMLDAHSPVEVFMASQKPTPAEVEGGTQIEHDGLPPKVKDFQVYDEAVDAAVDDVMRLEKELRQARLEERRARVARSQAKR